MTKVPDQIGCRICNANEYDLRLIKDSFRIEECLNCGLVQVTNPPTESEIASLYDQDFFDDAYHTLQQDPKQQAYEYKKFNFRMEEIEKFGPSTGSILDVGCSFGYFLDVAQRRGWEPYGLEISSFAASYAREHFGFEVVEQPLPEANYEDESFDVVTMWNVIEHLARPAEDISTVARILKPGGLCVLTTGSANSLLAWLQREKWRMYIPPIHISHFSPATIRLLLSKYGLEMIQLTYALPYEFALRKAKLLWLARSIRISDKMFVFARKTG